MWRHWWMTHCRRSSSYPEPQPEPIRRCFCPTTSETSGPRWRRWSRPRCRTACGTSPPPGPLNWSDGRQRFRRGKSSTLEKTSTPVDIFYQNTDPWWFVMSVQIIYQIQALLHNTANVICCCCCCLFLSKVFFGRFFVMMFMAASVTTATTTFPNALLLYRLLTSRLLQSCGEVMMRTDKQRIFLWFDEKRGGVFVFVVVVLSFLLLLHLQLDTKLNWSTNKGSI